MKKQLLTVNRNLFLYAVWCAFTFPILANRDISSGTVYSLVTSSSHEEVVEIAGAFEVLAINFAELGLINESSGLNQHAIKVYKVLENHEKIAANFYDLGTIYLSRGNLGEARRYFYSAYRYSELADLGASKKARYLQAIATVYKKKGQEDLARLLQIEADKIIRLPHE